jgi:hypothetical protein
MALGRVEARVEALLAAGFGRAGAGRAAMPFRSRS